MLRGMIWAPLKEKSPVNLDDVIHLSQQMKLMLMNLDRVDVKIGRIKIIRAKELLVSIIAVLISSFQHKEVLVKSSDKVIHLWLQENLGRLLGYIDLKTKEICNPTVEIDSGYLMAIGLEMNSILYSQIYVAIKKSIEIVPKNEKNKDNKREFLYCLWQITGTLAGILGSVTRESLGKENLGMGSSKARSFIPHYTALLSDKGQGYLEKYADGGGKDIPFPKQLHNPLDEEEQ